MSEYDFTEIVREIAESESIENCKLSLGESANKGDGYLSEVKAVQLIGTNKTLDVVMKYSHRKPNPHETMPFHDVYLNEMNFYRVVASDFRKFQQECRIAEPFDNTAEYYGGVSKPCNELLVLQNLRAHNYDMWDRQKLMDKTHLEYAMRIFGKFHGTSYAMKALQPERFNALAKTMQCNAFQRVLHSMKYEEQMIRALDELKGIFDSTQHIYQEKFTALLQNTQQIMDDLLASQEHAVVQQGDCWCNNLMFQYADKNDRRQPTNMKLIDFQLTQVGTPVMDLSYMFYSAAPQKHIDDWKHFLAVYHESLTSHMSKFGLDANASLSLEKLKEQWRGHCKFGLFLSIAIRKVMMMESKDAPDFTENHTDFVDKLVMNPEKFAIYREQMKGMVIHMVDNDFI